MGPLIVHDRDAHFSTVLALYRDHRAFPLKLYLSSLRAMLPATTFLLYTRISYAVPFAFFTRCFAYVDSVTRSFTGRTAPIHWTFLHSLYAVACHLPLHTDVLWRLLRWSVPPAQLTEIVFTPDFFGSLMPWIPHL